MCAILKQVSRIAMVMAKNALVIKILSISSYKITTPFFSYVKDMVKWPTCTIVHVPTLQSLIRIMWI